MNRYFEDRYHHEASEEGAYEPVNGWFSRLKRRLGFQAAEDEEEGGEEFPPRRSSHQRMVLQVHSPRPHEISVWMSPKTLEDAEGAANRLKERQPVLLNLENTEENLARRIVDFISGVTYALDGYYQRVGAKVFLFTPSNTLINVEDDLDQEQRGLFFEDHSSSR